MLLRVPARELRFAFVPETAALNPALGRPPAAEAWRRCLPASHAWAGSPVQPIQIPLTDQQQQLIRRLS